MVCCISIVKLVVDGRTTAAVLRMNIIDGYISIGRSGNDGNIFRIIGKRAVNTRTADEKTEDIIKRRTGKFGIFFRTERIIETDSIGGGDETDDVTRNIIIRIIRV